MPRSTPQPPHDNKVVHIIQSLGREFWILKAQDSRSWSRSRDTGLQLGSFPNKKTLRIAVMPTIKVQLKQKRPKRLYVQYSYAFPKE